ncbi:MAG: DUF697 domain-containing protein [Butyrivibrio sp.]|nr:DUF697 domain-containing protein [Butyrivibrio sp.]
MEINGNNDYEDNQMTINDNNDYEDDYLNDIQEYKYQEMFEKANNIVLSFTTSTGVTGAVPIPFADAPLLIAQQVAMMVAINSVFEIDIKRDALKSLATATIGVSGATVIGKTVASNLLKLIPGGGSVVGGAISAGTAGIITFALGKAYIEICMAIKMGKLNQSDLTKKAGLDMLKKNFKEQMKTSKK